MTAHIPFARSLLAGVAVSALVCCSSAAAVDAVPAADRTVAFVHANVVPMDSPQILPDETVLVRDGRIARVGPATDIDTVGAQVIDARGLYLMPGLADMHVHLLEGAAYFPLFLANGVTTVRNMAGGPGIAKLRDRVARGEILGPTIYTAGPLIDGSPPVWPGSDVVVTPEDAERAVASQRRAGYDFLKVYDNLQAPAYDAVVAAAAKVGLRIAGHVPPSVGLGRVLAARQWSIEHLTGYFEWLQRADSPYRHEADAPRAFKHPAHLLPERQYLVDWVDVSRIPAIASVTARAGVWNVPTLVAMRNMVPAADRDSAWKRPGMSYATAMLRAWWNSDEGYTAQDWADKRRGDALRSRIVQALHAAGAGLVIGTDSPHPFVMPGYAVHDELRNFVAAGLSPYEALKAATADAARFMDEAGDFGTVAPGARADLLLVEGNPLQDVGNVGHIVGVMVRGRWLMHGDLQRAVRANASPHLSEVPRTQHRG